MSLQEYKEYVLATRKATTVSAVSAIIKATQEKKLESIYTDTAEPIRSVM